jgi:type VI secretion system protein ImpH
MTVTEQLFAEGFAFDFFQAVRLLGRVDPRRRPVGLTAAPRDEIVRFRAHLSLNFPPSSVYEIQRVPDGPPRMTETFMGLTGPSGILPRHYTELLMRLDREVRGPERYALRAWLDLFNHRFVSLFYRAWEKYRFFLAQERGEHFGKEPDTFTQALYSFVGLGLPALRERLRVKRCQEPFRGTEKVPDTFLPEGEQTLAAIDDLALLYYGGLLSQRPRSAVALRALLADYFELPIEVRQFHGRWLRLEADNQTRLGEANAELGLNVVAGERVWDVQGMIRLRLGPLRRAQFDALLPDRSPIRERKAFFLLCHLARLYVGPELDFDVQLILRAEDVPACQLADDGGLGPRLGWNTWLGSQPRTRDADDAVFPGQEMVLV